MKLSHEETSPAMQYVMILTILGAFALIGLGGFLVHGASCFCGFCKIWYEEFRPEKEGDNY